MNESQIFANALQRADAAERAAYLDAACAGNPELRAAVEGLLQAHATDPGFLERPAPALGRTVTAPAPQAGGSEQAGTVLAGRYKLLEPIGEGGMGAVWLAKQTEPVKRRVAVKLIKTGMGSKAVLARFEAERQALALMDHPNIAKVFDAGAAPDGRPFFVMELVNGVPITRFCDQRKLTPRQRLALFVPVCQAVQHAHQKGVIHRDLKPSNVLVTLYDDHPVPKVIDFGVAKATGQQLTDKTLHTGFGTVVGTVEYMSPEQAGFNQLDVDTRSDVYALGVLLYELLTGTTPLGRKRLKEAALLEVLRTIREEETPPPSVRLSTSKTLAVVAAQRGLEPAQLTRQVRGEPDWIVMKAIEKDRGRRYESASGLARDLERYLADEPVEAGPPSAVYRLGKLLRRYRRTMMATASFVFLLATAAVVSTALAVWALRAEKGARDANQEVGRTLAKVTKQKDRAEKAEKETAAEAATLRASFGFFEEDMLGISDTRELGLARDGNIPLRVALDRAADNVGNRFQGRPKEEARVLLTIGNAYRLLRNYDLAEKRLKQAVELQRGLVGPEHPDTLTAMHALARVYLDSGRVDLAEPLIVTVLEARRRVLGETHRDTLSTLNNLGCVTLVKGKKEDALQVFLQGLGTSRRQCGPEDPLSLQFQCNLATAYRELGQSERAEPLYEQTLSAQHPGSKAASFTALQFGILCMRKTQFARAASLLDQALTGYLAHTGISDPETVWAAVCLRGATNGLAKQGDDLLNKKQYAEAMPPLRQFLDVWKKHQKVLEPVKPQIWMPCNVEVRLGRCLAGLKKYDEAEPHLLAGVKELWHQDAVPSRPWSPFLRDCPDALRQVANFYQEQGLPHKAAAWRTNWLFIIDPKRLTEEGYRNRDRRAYREAATCFLIHLCFEPGHLSLWETTAVMMATAGMEDDYRGLRREILARCRDTTDAQIAKSVARVCLLLPGSPEETRQARALAERAQQKYSADYIAHGQTRPIIAVQAVTSPATPSLASGITQVLAVKRFRETYPWLDERPSFEVPVALAEYRQGQFNAAERRLTRAVAALAGPIFWRDRVPARLVQGMARLRANPKDQAAKDALGQAIKDAPKEAAAGFGRAFPDWDAYYICEHLRQEAENVLTPKTPVQEAEVLMLKGKYKESADYLRRALRANPGDPVLWYHTAVMLAAAPGMRDEYGKHRKLMLARFRDTTDPTLARHTALACLLWPGSEEETKQAAALAERALQKSDPGAPRSHAELAVALAEYRRGKFAEADRRLALVLSGSLKTADLIFPARLLQCMARFQASSNDRTRAALDQAIKDYPRMMNGSVMVDSYDMPLHARFMSEAITMSARAQKKK